jgi:hypothetical protein
MDQQIFLKEHLAAPVTKKDLFWELGFREIQLALERYKLFLQLALTGATGSFFNIKTPHLAEMIG